MFIYIDMKLLRVRLNFVFACEAISATQLRFPEMEVGKEEGGGIKIGGIKGAGKIYAGEKSAGKWERELFCRLSGMALLYSAMPKTSVNWITKDTQSSSVNFSISIDPATHRQIYLF